MAGYLIKDTTKEEREQIVAARFCTRKQNPDTAIFPICMGCTPPERLLQTAPLNWLRLAARPWNTACPTAADIPDGYVLGCLFLIFSFHR